MPASYADFGFYRVALRAICTVACEAYDVTIDELRSPCRKQHLVRARMICVLLARTMVKRADGSPIPYTELRDLLNRKDHTSIIYLFERAQYILRGGNCAEDVTRMRAEVTIALARLELAGLDVPEGLGGWNIPEWDVQMPLPFPGMTGPEIISVFGHQRPAIPDARPH